MVKRILSIFIVAIPLFFLGGSGPFCPISDDTFQYFEKKDLSSSTGEAEINDPEEIETERDSSEWETLQELSPIHKLVYQKVLKLKNHSDTEKAKFLKTISEMGETELLEKTTLKTQQIYPNSCFGHSVLEALAVIDPMTAFKMKRDPNQQLEMETAIMAFFYNGKYNSMTRKDIQENKPITQILGGIDPSEALSGAENFLSPVTGLAYHEVNDRTRINEFQVTSETKLLLIKESFENMPYHPIIIYSINHALIILSYEERGDNTVLFNVHNPINGSVTKIPEKDLLISFDLPFFLFGAEKLLDIEVEEVLSNPKYEALFENDGFPNYGIILPVSEK